MKTKLTLRIRDDVKAEAKEIAAKRGVSVSQLVETYFQMLAKPKSGDDASARQDTPLERDTATGHDTALSPRIQAVQKALGQPAPKVEMDEDTRRWADHAAAKHA